MARSRTPRTSSRKRSRKAVVFRPERNSTTAILSLSFDDFRSAAVRWYLEQQLHAVGGHVARLAKRINKNRTDTYRLLTRHRVPVLDIQAAHGLLPGRQLPVRKSETQAALQQWLTSSPTARRQGSAIIAAHGR